MAICEGRTFFQGELDGKRLNDFFINKYELLTAEERINAVNELLQTNYFTEYFDKHFKVKLNASDELSSGINVCQTLEKLADYILNCKEVKDERKAREVEYRFYKNKYEFYERTKRENSGGDNIIDFLKDENKNFYLSNDQKITKEDLEEQTEVGRILREYDVMLEQCKKIPQFNKMLTQSKLVREDMLIAKNQLKGTIQMSGSSSGMHFAEFDSFDWNCEDHIKELLPMHKEFNPEDNLCHLLLALETYIKEMHDKNKLDDMEYLICKLLRANYKQHEICDMLDIKKSFLSRKIKKICQKISVYAKN